MNRPRIEIVEGKSYWYWRIRAANGRLLNHRYNSRKGAIEGVLSLTSTLLSNPEMKTIRRRKPR